MSFEKVEFKTLDGITLRGNLYAAKTKGPAIILGPGFNCIKEMNITTIARQFQKSNITALACDPRTLGESDGFPRNDFDPAKLVEDYSDALTFLSTHPTVNPHQIGFWGVSFNGAIALAAAVLDPRIGFVISCCPWFNYFTKEAVPPIYAAAAHDRASRLRGNEGSLVTTVTEQGSTPVNASPPEARKYREWMKAATPPGMPFHSQITHNTLASLAKWSLKVYIEHEIKAPVLLMIPELDELSPAQQQLELFDQIKGPKTLHIAKGRDHFNTLSGPDMDKKQKLQVDFIRDATGGKVRSML